MKIPHSLFSRRRFLAALTGGWAAALGATFIGPIVRLVLPPTREPDEVTLAFAEFRDMAAGEVRTFAWGIKPGLLKLEGDGSYTAFVGVCTHLDCNVAYLPSEKKFYCACHEGWYDEHGTNISGPPPAPLRRLGVAVEGENIMIRKQD
jgi:Rieske Fe-S protein